MGKRWELIEVNYATCDNCKDLAVCNIYESESGCNCLKCKSIRLKKEKNICGSCLGKWLKSRDIDDAE